MCGLLAQSVERRANNANVMSSILIQAIFFNLIIIQKSFVVKVKT